MESCLKEILGSVGIAEVVRWCLVEKVGID